MHRYTPRWPEDITAYEPPAAHDFTYRDARDVIAYAEIEPLTTWYTYPWLWHLDDSGRVVCYSKGSSLDDVERFASNPHRVLQCRDTDPGDFCPNQWFMIESRRKLRPKPCDVTEADAAAFISLRRSLAKFGINLLDDIVINEQFEWWSLHELTSGTTAWDFKPIPASSNSAKTFSFLRDDK